MFGVYRNLDLSDKIFDCLLTAITKVQFVDKGASGLLASWNLRPSYRFYEYCAEATYFSRGVQAGGLSQELWKQRAGETRCNGSYLE